MIRHVVRRGDSLWGLAGQYLGSGARWPEIDKFHNEFALGGRHPQLLPIKDPNLIFVGQTIFIPPRSSKPYTLSQGKPWPKVEVTKPATGLDLKVVYKIDDSQSQYKQVLPHCTLEAKLSGTIAIENMTHGRYRHNLELALSKDAPAVKQKLGEFSDHAFRDLTKGVELGFQNGRCHDQGAHHVPGGAGALYSQGDGGESHEAQRKSLSRRPSAPLWTWREGSINIPPTSHLM